ncbi:MAG: hypothetical protein U1D30_25815 [Planctomycetota bacterium]
MTSRLGFFAGQLLQGVVLGILLAVALWRLFGLSGSIPVFRYLMF